MRPREQGGSPERLVSREAKRRVGQATLGPTTTSKDLGPRNLGVYPEKSRAPPANSAPEEGSWALEAGDRGPGSWVRRPRSWHSHRCPRSGLLPLRSLTWGGCLEGSGGPGGGGGVGQRTQCSPARALGHHKATQGVFPLLAHPSDTAAQVCHQKRGQNWPWGCVRGDLLKTLNTAQSPVERSWTPGHTGVM